MKSQYFGVATAQPCFFWQPFDPVAHCLWNVRHDFKGKRMNGNESDNSLQKMPEDGKYTWVKGRVDGKYVHCVRNGNNYEYEVRYDQGPGDKAWMEETDKNYLERIEREGNFKKLEPAVYYLRLQERATNSLRDWWTQKLLLPNLPQILEQAEREATPDTIARLEQEAQQRAEQEAELKAKQAQIAQLQTKLQTAINETKKLMTPIQATNNLRLLPPEEQAELQRFITFVEQLTPATIITLDKVALNKNITLLESRCLYLSRLPQTLITLAAAEQRAIAQAVQERLTQSLALKANIIEETIQKITTNAITDLNVHDIAAARLTRAPQRR